MFAINATDEVIKTPKTNEVRMVETWGWLWNTRYIQKKNIPQVMYGIILSFGVLRNIESINPTPFNKSTVTNGKKTMLITTLLKKLILVAGAIPTK